MKRVQLSTQNRKQPMASEPKPSSREQLKTVRIRTGGVHFSGARIISLLVTDKSAASIASSNVVICDVITTHPAGVYFEAEGQTHIIPYANVEVMTVA